MAGQLPAVRRMSRRTSGALLLGFAVTAGVLSAWAWWRAWSAPLVEVILRPTFSVQGVTSGTPVRVNGVVVGQVSSIGLHRDLEGRVRPDLRLSLDPGSLEDRGFADRLRGDRLHEEVARGLVGRLVTVSPASGMLQVELLWDAERAPRSGLAPSEIPVTGGTLQQTYERLAAGFDEAARRDLALLAEELEADLDRWEPLSDPGRAAELNAAWLAKSEALAAGARALAEGPGLADAARACRSLREAVESADASLSPERIALLQARIADASAALGSFAASLDASRGVMEGASSDLSAAFRALSEAAKSWRAKAGGLTTEPLPPAR